MFLGGDEAGTLAAVTTETTLTDSARAGAVALLSQAAAAAPDARRTDARALYWQGWRLSAIAAHFGLARQVVHRWKVAERWDDAQPIDRVSGAIEARMVQLVAKPVKTGGDFKEIDLLGRQLERLARISKFESTGKFSDLNPALGRADAQAPKAKKQRNHFTPEDVEKLKAALLDELFDYQRLWWSRRDERTRMILKSRQIGATWYFAREALIKALETGHNQIFLSASKAQAHIFKLYIQAFAMEVCGVELKGDPIVLSNGAELHFLGNNYRTAQGYHGDFYFDEFFWAQGFEELNKVASAMALHKKWKKTYFSTPSSVNHQAYPMWCGDRFNKRRAKDQQAVFDVSHEALKGGLVGADGAWRNIVTIDDAVLGGCDLFDLEELRIEYSVDEYDNLLLCQFIDDTYSVFPLSELRPCMVDSWDEWARDFKPFAARPFGFKPVWVGYDPSHTGDTAGLVVVAPPDKAGGVFRVLYRAQFKGMDFEGQADAIKRITQQFNVVSIGIDTSGLGQGVYQLVSKFFPAAKAYQYSVEVKTRLVLKAKSVITAGRLQFDSSWVELAHAFLSIKRELTASGRNVTFDAGRSATTGHADLAWAVMHALDNEPLEGVGNGAGASIMEMS